MQAYDLFFGSMKPFDHFSHQKYFQTIQTLSQFNFLPCLEVESVKTLLIKEQDDWENFWSQEGSDELFQANFENKSDELEAIVDQIQNAWHFAEPKAAGKAFANYMRMLMENPKQGE